MIDQANRKVLLANGTSFDSKQDSTILNSAMASGISLEYSCRTGRCGVCKARVISGETTVLVAEASLMPQEIDAGMILTCCRSATTDLELDIEDLGDLGKFRAKTVPARIDSLNVVSHDVAEVVLRTPPSGMLDYRAGQYIDVIGPNGIRRSYSIANAPRDDAKLSLEIRKVEGGQLSQYWFEKAKLNDLLRIEGPLGTFCLRPNPSKNLIFLATGTGIAPVKAMLEELAMSTSENESKHEQIFLYWGGRVREDIYWQPDFPSLPLTFIPVLSRATEWDGRRGHVHQAALDDKLDLSCTAVYACGSEKMISSAKSALVGAGLKPKQFYSDAFVSSS